MGKHFQRSLLPEIAVKLAEELHQVPDPHPVVEILLIRQIGYNPFGLDPWTVPVDPDLAGGRCQQSVCQFDEGGLAAAIGSQESYDPPGKYLQVHMVQRHFSAVTLTEIPALQDDILHNPHSFPLAGRLYSSASRRLSSLV